MDIREKMRKGLIYIDNHEDLIKERLNGKELVYDYNNTRPSEEEKRIDYFWKKLGGTVGKATSLKE